jgi:ribosomal protein L16/L10AE
MAEQLKVRAEGELIVLVAEGEAGMCVVRLTLNEAERFEEAFQKATTKVSFKVEARKAQEGIKVARVEDDEEE